ncbi:hypothetical protein DDW05_01605 [Candidatus Nanobsidianus stetteri]|uniref:Uncharacterized protein n=1 Tax=Nanobsidianus stetteri TaxID=1294122 RepID=A0A2T9WTT5_NANST|nr:hypothetical protein DDW05_01605 [Candidatus Nanobsidianus stetteri]
MSINSNQIFIVFLIGWSILLGTYFSKFIEFLSSNLMSENLTSLIQIMGIIAMFFLSVLLASYIVLKMKDENEGIALELTKGLSILYIAGFILAIIPINNLTMFEYYVIISFIISIINNPTILEYYTIFFFIISIISYFFLRRRGYLFMNGDRLFKNFVFWAVIWSIMLGWYFFKSIKFIAYVLSTSLIYSSLIIGFIFLILLASYFLSEIEDLDDEKLKRLSIYITILYLIGDILAVKVDWLILIWIVIFAVILFILSLLEGLGKAENDLFASLLLLAIFLIIILIMGIISNTLVGFLLMLTILIIQAVIIILIYNAYYY